MTPSPMPSIRMSDWGKCLLQRGADAIEIARDRDVVGRDLLSRGIEEDDVGLADRGADDVGALRRTHDGIGDLRVGDQNVLDVARQVDDDDFPMPSGKNRAFNCPPADAAAAAGEAR